MGALQERCMLVLPVWCVNAHVAPPMAGHRCLKTTWLLCGQRKVEHGYLIYYVAAVLMQNFAKLEYKLQFLYNPLS